MTVHHQPTAAVRESFGQAQQHAAAMVAGPPTAWNEGPQGSRRSPLWLALAAVAVVAAGVAGWVGVDWWHDSERAAPVTARPLVDTYTPAPVVQMAPPVVATAPVVAAPALSVTRQSGVIRIRAGNATLNDVVNALARATQTTVTGGEALASITSPVTLHWQGTDTAAAWDALLGRYANIAVSCSKGACEVWVVGINAPRTGGAAPAAEPPRPVLQAPPPQPSEENTETN